MWINHMEVKVRIDIAKDVSVATDKDGNVYVTRPGMTGKIQTHSVGSDYTPLEVAIWLKLRLGGSRCKLVQEEFPKMSDEDREFLITGITPIEWKQMFKGGE
jgi:hypothetical protein